MANKYRKKPVVIEAIQHTGTNQEEVKRFMNAELTSEYNGDVLVIETLEGTMRADKGDYIIKGVQGEFYPCKPEIFEQTYEKINKIPSFFEGGLIENAAASPFAE